MFWHAMVPGKHRYTVPIRLPFKVPEDYGFMDFLTQTGAFGQYDHNVPTFGANHI
jgi:hypothetical protein